MVLPGEILVSGSIAVLSLGLFLYWTARALLVLGAPAEEVNSVLERDLWWGRRMWLALQILFRPPTALLSI